MAAARARLIISEEVECRRVRDTVSPLLNKSSDSAILQLSNGCKTHTQSTAAEYPTSVTTQVLMDTDSGGDSALAKRQEYIINARLSVLRV